MRLKTWIAGFLAVAAAASLAACKPINLKADPAAEAVASAAYDDIAAGRVAAVQARLTPDAAQAVRPDQVLAMRPYADPTLPTERRLIGMSSFNDVKGPQTLNLIYELTYPDHSVLYRLTLKRPAKAAPWRIEATNLNRATKTELAKGHFTLAGRSPAQFAFLAATILSPLLMLSALIVAIRAPGLKRKWLWAILALVGVGSATMNWTTGEAGFQPIMLNLIGAGIVKQGLSGFFPWMLKFTVPVGAVITHWRAAKARRDAKVVTSLDGAAGGA